MPEIFPNEVYTTEEAQKLLKVSNSTIKRLLNKGLLNANKIGGQYRILGHELLRALSPDIDRSATRAYLKIKKTAREKMKGW